MRSKQNIVLYMRYWHSLTVTCTNKKRQAQLCFRSVLVPLYNILHSNTSSAVKLTLFSESHTKTYFSSAKSNWTTWSSDFPYNPCRRSHFFSKVFHLLYIVSHQDVADHGSSQPLILYKCKQCSSLNYTTQYLFFCHKLERFLAVSLYYMFLIFLRLSNYLNLLFTICILGNFNCFWF